jgi:hypothetical protein
MKTPANNNPTDAQKSDKMNFCAPIEGTLKADILALKSEFGLTNNADVLAFLLKAYKNPTRSKLELTSAQHVEQFILKELSKPTQKINTHTIKVHMRDEHKTAFNTEKSKEIISKYASEIEAHNLKFAAE